MKGIDGEALFYNRRGGTAEGGFFCGMWDPNRNEGIWSWTYKLHKFEAYDNPFYLKKAGFVLPFLPFI